MNPFLQAVLSRSGVIPAALNPKETVVPNITAARTKPAPVHASGVAVSVSPYPIDFLPAVALCSDGTIHDYVLTPFPGKDKQTPDVNAVWEDADQRCRSGKSVSRTESLEDLSRMWLEIRPSMESNNPQMHWQFSCEGADAKTEGTNTYQHTKGQPSDVRSIALNSFKAAQSACRQQGATR